MFRSTLLRSLRAPVSRAVIAPITRAAVAQPFNFQFQKVRSYSAGAGLTPELAKERIYEILEGFSKVEDAKITPEASFTKDLGLDSLDVVDIVMTLEEEFSIEIPDIEADEIKTVQQAIDYVLAQPDSV